MNLENDIFAQALKNGLDELKAKFETGDFTRLASGFTFNKEKKVAEFDESDFRGYEQVLVEDTTRHLYTFLFTNPMVFAMAMSKVKIKEPKTITDFSTLTIDALAEMKKYYAGLQKEYKSGVPEHLYLFFGVAENRQSFERVIKVVDKLAPYFENAMKVEKICSDKNMSDEEFLRLAVLFNSKMSNSLVTTLASVENWEDLGPGFEVSYIDLMNHFRNCAREISETKKQFDGKKQESVPIARRVAPVEISPEEKMRLATIREANNLYDELVHDTMRDLQAQVPYSAREMYEYFVDVKFANFVKEHNMPLSNTTSLRQAQDVVAKLNALYNYVSKISENSKVSVVYGNEWQ